MYPKQKHFMMKKLILALSVFQAVELSAQDTKIDSTKHWSIEGQNTLMLNQAAFSNWVGGGANTIGWLAGVNYSFTFKKDRNLLENNVVLGYGQNDTQGLGKRKSQDIINLSANYGYKIGRNWYVSAGAGLLTQFATGYADGNNPAAAKISNFMAPGYLDLGAGFTYRPSENFTMTLRPTNARWTFVLYKDLQKAGNYGLKNDGDSSLFQFGFLGNAKYKVNLLENITLMNTASVFSDYLDHPERLVLSYGGILNMKVNKHISTNITLDLFYDHNQIKRVQLKQTLGVGFAYNIDNGVKFAEEKRNKDWKK